MHGIYLACLVGGLLATVLFAALGALGGGGHGHVHLHAGAGHAHAPAGPQLGGSVHAHALPGAQSGGSAHAHALPGSSQAAQAGGHGTSQAQGQAQGSAIRPAGASSGHGVAGRAGLAVGWAFSWLSPLTLAAAALWFGGVGLVGEGIAPRSLGALLVILAVAAGLLGAAFVRALMAAFVRAGTPPLRGDAVGAVGTLNAPIRVDGVGEVVYTLEGLRRSAPARSLDGATMPRGTPVVIVRRERGMAWVAPLDPLAALPTVPDAESLTPGPSPAAGRGAGGEGSWGEGLP